MARPKKYGSQPMRDGIEPYVAKDGTTTYRGVINTKTHKENGPRLPTRAEAKAWRNKALGELQAGKLRRSNGTTVREAWEAFYAGAKAGTIMDRTGKPYSPSTLGGYERAWRLRLEPELGPHRLDRITHTDLQAMVDDWAKDGVRPSTINNTMDPLRTLYRRAVKREGIVNPTTNLDIGKVDNKRERFATREEAAELLAALPDGERAIWTTAFYTGLRRGELRALRWTHVDLDSGLIHVQRSWAYGYEEGPPKSKAGKRKVAIVPQLASALRAHKLATGRSGSDLVFGRTATDPYVPTTVRNRALAAWKARDEKLAEDYGRALRDDEKLEPITLHECRHTFASFMIAAGANAKALSVVMGHESITITFDRYGKLMPGGEQEVGQLVAAYLSAA